MARQTVIDANVFASALRSRSGTSHRLLLLLGRAGFDINVSVPLVLEYEDAAMRTAREAGLTRAEVGCIIDYVCRVANLHTVNFLWRPILKDPGDDHVLELAAHAGCRCIVAGNVRDFAGAERLGIAVVTPKEFLRTTGGRR
jgi:predicted nucleic acid-binding protein